ncbi:hypothetical protein [Halovivax gelatinilyticus]|nr:hypothetical protein [Halovivax gelatinilyticus]
MTDRWAELFDRASAYDVSERDLCDRLATLRDRPEQSDGGDGDG